MPFILYCITNAVNGKKYIGITARSSSARFKNHCKEARKKRHNYRLYNAIRTHGANNFSIIDIAHAFTFKDLLALERLAIAQYGTFDKAVGYNMTAGGEGTLGCRRDMEKLIARQNAQWATKYLCYKSTLFSGKVPDKKLRKWAATNRRTHLLGLLSQAKIDALNSLSNWQWSHAKWSAQEQIIEAKKIAAAQPDGLLPNKSDLRDMGHTRLYNYLYGNATHEQKRELLSHVKQTTARRKTKHRRVVSEETRAKMRVSCFAFVARKKADAQVAA